MDTADTLYAELNPDIQAICTPLFEFSQMCLMKRGDFLPHGAVLSESGEIIMVAAAPDTGNDRTNSTEVLPVLHEGLRDKARTSALRAIAIAENVAVTRQGHRRTDAIKVLVEHKRGLTLALYIPFERRARNSYDFGEMFLKTAPPEVNAWT